jgi:hypothetical protein
MASKPRRATSSILFWFLCFQYNPYLWSWNRVLLISQNWLDRLSLPIFGAWRKISRLSNRDLQLLFETRFGMVLCPPVLSSIPDRVSEMTKTGYLASIPVYILRRGLKIGFCVGQHLS